jgi:hypothetical protein
MWSRVESGRVSFSHSNRLQAECTMFSEQLAKLAAAQS